MKNQPTKIIPCLLAGFILSACVGAVNIDGTDGNGSGNIPSGTILTEHVSDGVASLNVTGRADCVIRWRGDTPYASLCGITADLSRDTFSRTRGGSNPILRVDGINYEFNKDDAITRATGSGFISGEGYTNRFGRVIIVGDTSGFVYYNTRERLEYQARNDAGIVGDYFSDIYTPGDTVGFATFGTKIAVDNLSLKGTYSAEGQFNLDTYNHFTEHFITKQVSNRSGGYQGDLTLNVDFDANTVSGTADNFKYYGNGTTQDISGTASFVSADIVGSGFAGDLTFNRAFHQSAGFINTINAKYAGDFFGDGDVLAGVVQFASASIADRNVLGIGGFRAVGEVTTRAEAARIERERIAEAERVEAERVEAERIAEAERVEAERIAEAARIERAIKTAEAAVGRALTEQPATAIWSGTFLGVGASYHVDFSAGTFEFSDGSGGGQGRVDIPNNGRYHNRSLSLRAYFGNHSDADGFYPGQLGGQVTQRSYTTEDVYDDTPVLCKTGGCGPFTPRKTGETREAEHQDSADISGYIGEQGAEGNFSGDFSGSFVAGIPKFNPNVRIPGTNVRIPGTIELGYTNTRYNGD